MIYLILFNVSTLLTLSFAHVFWLLGGKTGLKYAFPHNSKYRKKVYKPEFFVLFFITLVILAMTFFCIAQLDVIDNLVDDNIVKWGNRFTAIILIGRAIGNFKYLGLTKSFTESEFAKLDTYVYSPLCLLLAFTTLILDFLT